MSAVFRDAALIRREALISMWIFQGAALSSGPVLIRGNMARMNFCYHQSFKVKKIPRRPQRDLYTFYMCLLEDSRYK